MLEIDVPGHGRLQLAHLIMDYNGTLAVDGDLAPGVGPRLEALAGQLNIEVITADTFGKVKQAMAGLPCEVAVLPPGAQDIQKQTWVEHRGADHAVCIGNGRNDRLMLQTAALGIAVILKEGAHVSTLQAADVVCLDICDALDLLLHPLRLTATLRS